ncbi:MAG: 16S rRNA (cytosine(967)-C(5))-methyltransferase RsmB [Rhodocyclaceae bacterium]|nr:16S rRNA (cytosine(967)-C(5))-methyltransferase RsmB [Rhodocyclaceae bacterium]
MNQPKSLPLAAALAAAANAVAAVLKGHTPEAPLAQAEAALRPAALDLAFTTLRDYGRGDFLLGKLLEKPLKDNSARALLLVALARLERRPDAAHTLVDQAVTAAGKRFKGLTNAVLRNFLRRRDELLAAADADPVAHWRLPHWWLEKLRAAYPDQWQAIATAGSTHPPMCLRINRRRVVSANFRQELAAAGIDARALDDTALLLDKPLPVERIAGFREGKVSVQDWGAQHAARLLDAQDGMRVLDACAAPGGKTAHLLELADLDLTALELDPQRTRRIIENLDRLGLKANIQVADASRPADWWDGRFFERILADVPCSASGVARRHPDIKWLRRAADVAGFGRRQAAILDALWPLLAPGGKMLHCTCSVFAEENSAQVCAFVTRHPDAHRLPTGGDTLELQLLPTAIHDGFYYALLEKTP